MAAFTEEAFRIHPMKGADGEDVELQPLALVGRDEFVASLTRKQVWARRLRALLPARSSWSRRLAVGDHEAQQVLYLAKIYARAAHVTARKGRHILARTHLHFVARGYL